ncbi:amidohydrolase [Roseibium sp. CAU 1637]|uniref:Amidohydrolase n=1 Tax=Roseibium limicola TaxID=2816037 RepID=A0A939EKQ0_9HYPH|nr:amidohydrolase [Roseibium limicola]MBO0344187.1 amidohydrolase [Roseibium limicola]
MTADLIILNGHLITFDPDQPSASALAVKTGKILAVGKNPEIKALAGPETKIIDAAGGTVLPGFIDSHVHLFGGSVELDYLNLYGVQGLDELAAKVQAWAADCPDDAVVFAVQADYSILGPGQVTTRQALDLVLPDRPFAMFAPDHHTMWANTKALELVGFLHGKQVDKGSEIMMAADGTASGELREPAAYGPVLALTRFGGRDLLGMVTGADPVPPATPEQRALDKAAIAKGLRHCAAQGITGLHNMDGNFYQLELLSELEADGDLLCRVEVPFHFKNFDQISRFEEAVEMRAKYQGDWIWCSRVKMFIDGVVESSTALMLEPYPGLDTIGDAVFEQAHFNAAIVKADELGLQVAVHAIGDRGIRWTLDAYELARTTNGVRDSRHRIEHIEVLHSDDLPRFKQLDVVASIQPGHAPFGGVFPSEGVEKMLHPAQIPTAYAWQDLRDSGVPVIFSTDWPVIGVEVMPSVKAAIAPVQLGAPWRDQTQSLLDTLESYTAMNAWVEFNEGKKGRLMPGMLADIAVMSHDLQALAPAEITTASCVATIAGGRVTYEA